MVIRPEERKAQKRPKVAFPGTSLVLPCYIPVLPVLAAAEVSIPSKSSVESTSPCNLLKFDGNIGLLELPPTGTRNPYRYLLVKLQTLRPLAQPNESGSGTGTPHTMFSAANCTGSCG